MKNFLYLLFIIAAMFFIRFSISFIFNKLYFPNFPEKFNAYVMREEKEDRTGESVDNVADQSEVTSSDERTETESNENIRFLVDYSPEGCANFCRGRVEKTDCTKYNDKFDFCQMNCYGYMYNSCTSGYAGLLVLFLTE